MTLTFLSTVYQIFKEVNCYGIIRWQVCFTVHREEIIDLSFAFVFSSKSVSCDLL